MTERHYKPEVDYHELGRYLDVLSVPTRLELLRKLQVPRAVSEIDLPPMREDGLDAQRPISRQAIEKHLEKLLDAGLVSLRAAKRDGRAVKEYVVNQARLFALVEEIRRLTVARSAEGTASGADADEAAPEIPATPALLLANGPLEGAVFPLEGAGPWRIGRERGLAVPLLYDPFVSAENARIVRAGATFSLEASPGARNGTRVNWRRLQPGARVDLQPGDVIGVGRSLLVLRGR